MLTVLLFCSGTILLFAFIHFLSKKKKPFKRAFISAMIGPLSLLLINVTSSLSGVYVPISELSLMTAAAGGIPGAALLVMMTLLV